MSGIQNIHCCPCGELKTETQLHGREMLGFVMTIKLS